MSQFVLRFYYFLEDDIESLKKLTEIFNRNGLISTAKDSSLSSVRPDGVIYSLDYPQGNLKILAVKTPLNSDYWETALTDLNTWEEEDPLIGTDIMGCLTILAGSDPWGEMFEKASVKFTCAAGDNIIELKNGKLASLVNDNHKGEAVYLCGLNETDSVPVSLLFRQMPLFYAGILRLKALDFVLNDRLLSIRREKDEMQRDLINILHTKLVMGQALLLAAEELENEIQGLATSYGKLVGDQSMIADGVQDLETALLNLERQIHSEATLESPAIFFEQITEPFLQRLEDLRNIREELNEVKQNYQAAIDVVQSKIEVMNSRTNIATQEQIKGLLEVNTEMQKQGLVYQYAAGLIEFIVLAYYSHTLWAHLQEAAYSAIPSWIQFVTVIVFSGNIVWATHLIAEYKQGEVHVRKKLILAVILFLILFAFIIAGSILTGGHAAEH